MPSPHRQNVRNACVGLSVDELARLADEFNNKRDQQGLYYVYEWIKELLVEDHGFNENSPVVQHITHAMENLRRYVAGEPLLGETTR